MLRIRAQRLVPRTAELALAAGGVVDERDAPAVGGLRHDLVAEHDSRMGDTDLLDVGATEPAGEDADELPRPIGLADVRELGPPQGLRRRRAPEYRTAGRDEEDPMAVKLHRCGTCG